MKRWEKYWSGYPQLICSFVLRFYGPINPMGSCWAWSVNLTTHLLYAINQYCANSETDNCPSWINGRLWLTTEIILWWVIMTEMDLNCLHKYWVAEPGWVEPSPVRRTSNEPSRPAHNLIWTVIITPSIGTDRPGQIMYTWLDPAGTTFIQCHMNVMMLHHH